MSVRDWLRTQATLVTLVEAKSEELREYGKAFDSLQRSMRRIRERSARLFDENKTLRRQLADANEQLNVQARIGIAIWPPRTRGQAEAIDDHARDKRYDDRGDE